MGLGEEKIIVSDKRSNPLTFEGPSRPGIEGLNTLKEMPKSLSFEEKEKEGRISSPTHFEKEEILGNLGNEEQGPQFYIQNSLHESKLEPSIVSEEERAVDEDDAEDNEGSAEPLVSHPLLGCLRY
ncbi:hypothetical protein U1Q18_003320 [Sarracenia purpurea var. burkii]